MLTFYNTKKRPDIKKLLFEENTSYYYAYSGSLVVTNEMFHIATLKRHLSKDTKVLTVSGSGEQPLFFKIYGAKDIVTFDISFTSYLLTSLKISAAQIFTTSTEYNIFLNDLYTIKTSNDLFDKPYLSQAIQNMSKENQSYISKIVRYQLISRLLYLNDSCNFYSLNQEQFDKLKKSIETDIPFIWTNITRLYKGINKEKFDIIYYSNILSFKDEITLRPILEKTKQHLTQNGKLFLLIEPCKINQITNAVNDVFQNDYDKTLSPKKEYFHQMIIQHSH